MEMLNNRMFPFNFIYSIWMKLRRFDSCLGLILFSICKEIITISYIRPKGSFHHHLLQRDFLICLFGDFAFCPL